MTGADRFRDAVASREVAFAPLVWARLAELVHQPADHWWRDPGRAHRLVADAARVASADAMFVATAADAAAAVCAAGQAGEDGLEELAGTEESRVGCELVERLKAAEPFAVIAALPGVAWLTERFGAEAPEAAEDALSDMARAYLDAGADALAVIGEQGDDIAESAARAGTAGAYYGRPVLAIRVDDGGGRSGWVESGGSAPISFLSDTGEWPERPLGVVTTPGDVSAAWDTALLHEAGVARRPRTA